MKFKIKYKHYLYLFVIFFTILIFGPLVQMKKSIEFDFNKKLDKDKIITFSGDTLVFKNKRPNYFCGEEQKYIGYVENDTISDFRFKLNIFGEIVYYFKFNNVKPIDYGSGICKTCNIDYDDLGSFPGVFWVTIIFGAIFLGVRIGVYRETNYRDISFNSKYKKAITIYMILEYLFVLMLTYHTMNYFYNIPWFFMGLVYYGLMIWFLIHFEEDFESIINKYYTIKTKTKEYTEQYNKLLNHK